MRREKMKGATLILAVIALALAVPIGAGSAWAQQSQQTNASNPQISQPSQGGVNWAGAGWGAATLASNVVYIPAKLVYGVLGGLVGGASWALTGGNSQTADTIWRSSLGGDYVVTPDMLQGKKPVHFSGPTATAPAQASTVQPVNPLPGNSVSSSAGATAPTASASTGAPTTLANNGSPASSGAGSTSWSSGSGTAGSGTAGSGTGLSYSGSQPTDAGSGPVHRSPAGSPATALPSTSVE